MNYIHHLTGFFHRISTDNRLNPTHVSLYMALFQFWNVNHFGNPISICRQDLMKISKISAKATYHKCINDLHAYGYIVYEPSNNAFKGSFVTMPGFQAGAKLRPLSDRTKKETAAEPASVRSRTNIGTGAEPALVPSINYINNTNTINQREENNENITGSKNDSVAHTPKEISVVSDTHPTPVVTEPPVLQSPTGKKPKGGAAIPPTIEEVQAYFTGQNCSVTESEKFYNYFQSNGWKVGGKTPMKDWQAAARNWMINAVKFSQHINDAHRPNPPRVDVTATKNYSEPL